MDNPEKVSSRSARGSAFGGWGVAAGIAVAAVWAVLRCGVSVSPALPDLVQAATIWPQRLDDNLRAYFTDSPLDILAYRALPWQSSQAFTWLTLAASLAAIIGIAIWIGVLAPEGQRARAARLMILAPLPAVLLTWIGGYDGFTVLACLACLYAWAFGRPWLLVLAGILFGFQHFEHAILCTLALVLTWLAVREYLPARLTRFSPGWAIPGVIVGKVLLVVILAGQGSSISGRGSWLSEFLREWTVTAVSVGPTLLWACFAGSWAILIAFVIGVRSRRALILLGCALAIGFLATALSGDRPRVIALVLAPSLALITLALLAREDEENVRTRTLVLVETLVWIAPPIFLWGKAVIGTNVIDQLIVTTSQILG